MSCLAPCPACGRHVATDETTCPFCAVALPESFRHACSSRRPPSGRLSRTARLAVGAALIGVQASCASAAYGTMAPYDASVADTATSDSNDDGNDDGNTNDSAGALYGVAPAQLEQTPPRTDDGTSDPKPKKN